MHDRRRPRLPPRPLTVGAFSSNTALVPNANIVLRGSGTNRTLIATPAADQFGTATITVMVMDGDDATATDTFFLTVSAVNDPPTISDIEDQFTNEDFATGALDFMIGDVETPAVDLVITATSSNTSLVPNANIVLNGNGANHTITVTPTADQFGTTNITVTVTDADGATATDTFLLTVVAVNDKPTISDIADQSIDEDSTTGALAFTIDDVETEAAALSVTATSSNTTLLPNANIVLSGSGANRTLTATPSANQFGTTTITVTVTDGDGATTTDIFLLTVNAVNDPPTFSDIEDQFTDEDITTGALDFTVGDVETAAVDLVVTATSSNAALVPHANLIFGGSGANRTLTATPAADQFGTTTITVTVTDADGATATDTFMLTVNPINDPPTISDIANQSITENHSTGPLAFVVGDNETSAASLILTATSSTLALFPNVNLVFVGTGAYRSLIATPVVDQTGSATITVAVTDGDGVTATDTFSINVVVAPKFFVVDGASDKTFHYSAGGTYRAQTGLASGNSNPRGIAASPSGDRFWVVDKDEKVYVYDAALTPIGSWTPRGAKRPTGISVSGADVLIVDSNLDEVLVYANAASRLSGFGIVTRSFSLAAGNNNPEDLVTDGTSVWVVQSGSTDKVYVYRAGDGVTTATGPSTRQLDADRNTLDPPAPTSSLWLVDR